MTTAGGKVVMWVLYGGMMHIVWKKYWLSNMVAFEVMLKILIIATIPYCCARFF